MIKRVYFYILLILCFFSFSCIKGRPSVSRQPVYPDKNLKEIIIRGYYFPGNKQALEELKKELRTNEKCDRNDRLTRCYGNRLYIGESLEEALKNRYSSVGKEGFSYSAVRVYCYNETSESAKKPIYSNNLRIRLYDKNDNLLSEDFLRWDGRSFPKFQNVISYLPYHDEAYKMRVVKSQGNNELILEEKKVFEQSYLREKSDVDRVINRKEGWVFDEESECHISSVH